MGHSINALGKITGFVQDQLAVDPRDSKKFVMTQFGVFVVLGITLGAGALIYFVPLVAGNIAALAQIAVTAVGGLVATYVGGQSAVEFRANSVLKSATDNVNINRERYDGYDSDPDNTRDTMSGAGRRPFGGEAFEP